MRHIRNVLVIITLMMISANVYGRGYNRPYTGKELDHIAFPIGGIGTGMICFEGTGCLSNVSLFHYPQLFNEPCTFAAIHVDGVENGTKVLEAPVPDYKYFGRLKGGMGSGDTTWGFPRFDGGVFDARFPFAVLSLKDNDVPLDVKILAWNPFIPNDEDDSGLPVGGFEYSFTNTSTKSVKAVFSFNTKNFARSSETTHCHISKVSGGFVLNQDPETEKPYSEAHVAVWSPSEGTNVDCGWFRGRWFDSLTMAWNKVSSGDVTPSEPKEGSDGASLFVPFELAPGETRTVMLRIAWYVPESKHRIGSEAQTESDFGDRYDPSLYEGQPKTYRPWYATRFSSIDEVVSYWDANYDALKERTELFTDSFYDSTLPAEVIEAIADNLTILKSPTVMRQHDGRFWAWEGSGDSWGSCRGSCEHVWNYAQAVPHLFPRLERSLRETEFLVDQNTEGHQAFRANLPIRPLKHNFHAAADGQLGGIIKVYRDWRISGDTEWLKDLYPLIRKSMEYCIRTWDPDEEGAIIEPHHNTYDIEFWGPDGMHTSFYSGALACMAKMGRTIGMNKDVKRYETLLAKSKSYMDNHLWNGEYYIQDIRWTELHSQDPTKTQSFHSTYSQEALELLKKEGPKYQYGDGCHSDGVLGYWMSLTAGIEEPGDRGRITSHLDAVYRYNLKHDLSDHANPQRPGYALGHEGGLLLCTWPHGGKLSLPFVYSDEVWTGIEFQVAAHLMFEGLVDEGLDIVRTCLDRYDGVRRNPFNEYECGSWYARALSCYSMLQALTGVRYDAVEKTLYFDSKVGEDFRTFLSTATGYATVGLRGGVPFVEVKEGTMDIRKYIVSGKVLKN